MLKHLRKPRALLAVAGFVTCSTTALQSLYLSQRSSFLMTFAASCWEQLWRENAARWRELSDWFCHGFAFYVLWSSAKRGALYFAIAFALPRADHVRFNIDINIVCCGSHEIRPPKRARVVVFLVVTGYCEYFPVGRAASQATSTAWQSKIRNRNRGNLVTATPAGWPRTRLLRRGIRVECNAIAGFGFPRAVALCSFIRLSHLRGKLRDRICAGPGNARGSTKAAVCIILSPLDRWCHRILRHRTQRSG